MFWLVLVSLFGAGAMSSLIGHESADDTAQTDGDTPDEAGATEEVPELIHYAPPPPIEEFAPTEAPQAASNTVASAATSPDLYGTDGDDDLVMASTESGATIYGGAGNDHLAFFGGQTANGGWGEDILDLTLGSEAGTVTHIAAIGDDTLNVLLPEGADPTVSFYHSTAANGFDINWSEMTVAGQTIHFGDKNVLDGVPLQFNPTINIIEHDGTVHTVTRTMIEDDAVYGV